MNWKTLLAGAALILWLILVVFIKPNKQDTPAVETASAESNKQANNKSLTEIKEEIQFIVQDSIEEEIQKEVQKEIEQSTSTMGSSK